ncbi:MAG: hypothetical protein IT555_12420 [Acetobacteraceae bacterium]|nr:hypothetical protein [Acetobacteraceae bacterium]
MIGPVRQRDCLALHHADARADFGRVGVAGPLAGGARDAGAVRTHDAVVDAALMGAARRGARRQGKLAGLPELDELFQPAEQPGEAGDDHGVQGRRQPAMRVVRRDGGAHAGDLISQRGGLN